MHLQPYLSNPEFVLHCHPLDSVNPGFIWRAPLVKPYDFHVQGFIKWANKNLDSGLFFFAARIARRGRARCVAPRASADAASAA